MAAPFNNLRSKNDRAIAAYLILLGNCGSINDIFPFATSLNKTYPNTTIRSTLSKPEPPFTGSRRITTHISIKGVAVVDPPGSDANAPRIAFDARCASTMDALMQTDDNQTLRFTAAAITAAGQALAVAVDNSPQAIQFAKDNADMADYTCQDWFEAGEGEGEANEPGAAWEQVLMFESLCCASALG